jgi:hypothetical protein
MSKRSFQGQRSPVAVAEKMDSTELEPAAELIGVVGGRSDRVIPIGGRPFRAAATELVVEYDLITRPGEIRQRGQVLLG